MFTFLGRSPRGDVRGIAAQVVEAVADHADRHAAAVQIVLLAGHVGVDREVGLVDRCLVGDRLQVRLAGSESGAARAAAGNWLIGR